VEGPAAPVQSDTPVVTSTAETCVLADGDLVTVRVDVRTTGDTVVDGRPFAEVYADTGQYAAGRSWYVESEPIDYDPRNVCYAKYGRPRAAQAGSLVRLGAWRGVPVFRERGSTAEYPEVIYVAFAPGCVFQLYQYFTSLPPVACPQLHRFVTP
jgi:hypothetical protein